MINDNRKKGVKGDPGTSAYISTSKDGQIVTIQAEDAIHGKTTTYLRDGADGRDGIDGVDGVTPTLAISTEFNTWIINGVDTGVYATGPKGDRGEGFKISATFDTIDDLDPTGIEDGQLVTVIDGGLLLLRKSDYVDPKGKHDGWVEIGDFSSMTAIKGDKGDAGENGITPTIDPNTYHWMLADTDTGVVAKGEKGDQGDAGFSPYANVVRDELQGRAEITIIDSTGTHSAKVYDGLSPSAKVERLTQDSVKITITDKNGTTTQTIQDAYSPDATVSRANDKLTISLHDKTGTTTESIVVPQATVSKTGNKATVTIIDDVHGTTSVDILDAENAYDDTEVRGLISTNTSNISANTAAITTLNANDTTVGSVDYKIAQALSGFSSLEFKIVTELPNPGQKGYIYLLPSSDPSAQNIYKEFIWIGDKYEQIGSTEIDLSEYAKKTEIPDKVSQLTNDSGYLVSNDLTGYALKTELPGVASTTATGTVTIDGTTIKIDENGVIHSSTEGAASSKEGNILVEESDGLYVPPVPLGSSSQKGIVKVDGATISADNDNVISVMVSEESGNAVTTQSDGLYVGTASATTLGAIKVDAKTIGVTNQVAAVKVSTQTAKSDRISRSLTGGQSYTFINSHGASEPAVSFGIIATSASGATTNNAIHVVVDSTNIADVVDSTYNSTIVGGNVLVVTCDDNATGTVVVDDYAKAENVITSETDGLMVDRYSAIATTLKPGFVLPDGDTVSIDSKGKITARIGSNSVSRQDRNLIQLLDDGIYVDADDTVEIATTEEEGKVKLDGNTIIRTAPEDPNDGTIAVNTDVIATQSDVTTLNDAIDAVDMATPTLVPYTEDELYNLAWTGIEIESKPEYTEEDLDEILDSIVIPTIASSADKVTYDNSTSGMTANNVQSAIDSLAAGSGMKPATSTTIGAVKPDGTTITVSEDGTISSVANGSVTDVIYNNASLVDDDGVATLPAFITNAVSDLANYYTKDETYTTDEIDSLVSEIPKFSIEVVTELPTEDISTTTIYLLVSGTESSNMYDEYIYVNDAWEKLGTQKVDLTGYVKNTDYASSSAYGIVKLDGVTITATDGVISASIDTSAIETAIGKDESGNLISVSSRIASEAKDATFSEGVTIAQAITAATGFATTEVAGQVKPDGTTITVDADGTIHGASLSSIDNIEDVTVTSPSEGQVLMYDAANSEWKNAAIKGVEISEDAQNALEEKTDGLYVKNNMWSGTMAEYLAEKDSILDGTQVLIKDDYVSGAIVAVADMNYYSTDEKVVGCWVDGKPVYRKVIKGTTPATASRANLSLNGSVDDMVKLDGFIKLTDSIVPIPQLSQQSQVGARSWISTTDNAVCLEIDSETYCNKPVTLIVEYTKTTDQEDSFTPELLTNTFDVVSASSNNAEF